MNRILMLHFLFGYIFKVLDQYFTKLYNMHCLHTPSSYNTESQFLHFLHHKCGTYVKSNVTTSLYHFDIISSVSYTKSLFFQTFLLVFAIPSLAKVLFLIPPLCLLMTLVLGLVLEAM